MSKAKEIKPVKYVFSDVVSLVKTYANDKKIVLEIGSGTGNNLVFFAENDFDTHGVEIDQRAIDFAHDLLQNKNLKADIRLGDATKLPYNDGMFDLVLDRACLQHNKLDKIVQIIKEVERVLVKNGIFIIVNFISQDDFSAKDFDHNSKSLAWWKSSYQIYDDIHYTDKEELRSLLKNFEIIYMEHIRTEVLIPQRYDKGSYILVAKKL